MGEDLVRKVKRKTPGNATELEREQLRFFLQSMDLGTTLSAINPSLAWLPIILEMQFIEDRQLVPWIERNFDDAEALQEVVANIHFFGQDAARLLEYRLNSAAQTLPPLLLGGWSLIIRHIRTINRDALQNEWFEVAPRLKRQESSPELFDRLVEVLRPKLRVSKRISFSETDDAPPEHVTDLMSVDYEVDGVDPEEALAALEGAPVETIKRLLEKLTSALNNTLDDVTNNGLESSVGYGITDSDVPSIAKHPQNAYRTGFYPIVRVTADLWERLAKTSAELACQFVERWSTSSHRFMHRLALFACGNSVVSSDQAANVLLTLPQVELFLTNASVEVIRLIRLRWIEFDPGQRATLLERFSEGPPHSVFRDGSNVHMHIDRARFDVLAEMERSGFDLEKAAAVLNEVRARWPKWSLRAPDQAGFHVWHEFGLTAENVAENFVGVPDDQLVREANRFEAEGGYFEGESWQNLCRREPDRVLRALGAAGASGEWPVSLWRKLLWTRERYAESTSERHVAELLLLWPSDTFENIADAASDWLSEHFVTLNATLLWSLWDRIACSLKQFEDTKNGDLLTESLNAPSGRLAEILIKTLGAHPAHPEPRDPVRDRLCKLISIEGNQGLLARARLAVDLPFLFDRVPSWTMENLIPRFTWSSPDAAALWAARRYSQFIGSPDLFTVIKESFLQIFERTDVSPEELRVFASWLILIMIHNKVRAGGEYPLVPTEVRAALRRAGTVALVSAGHRLAMELERVGPEQRGKQWDSVVGPIFTAVWPLDVELQTKAATFTLVKMLIATGDAFPQAAEIVIPFIRPDDRGSHSSVFSLSTAPEELYVSSPKKMLALVAAVVGEAAPNSVFALKIVLDKIRTVDPRLADERTFQKLAGFAAE